MRFPGIALFGALCALKCCQWYSVQSDAIDTNTRVHAVSYGARIVPDRWCR